VASRGVVLDHIVEVEVVIGDLVGFAIFQVTLEEEEPIDPAAVHVKRSVFGSRDGVQTHLHL
jgi:hypothetical protein